MPRTKTPGALIKQLTALRAQFASKNAEATAIAAERDEIELELIQLLKKQGVTRISTAAYTASHTKRILPTVVDWDAFYNFMLKEKALYMLERRPASVAYRDMLEARDGESIPGVESYEKETISLRKTS